MWPLEADAVFANVFHVKPAKYEVKIRWCCDSQTCYPLKGDVYLGTQPGQLREVGQGARVVEQLVETWRRSGRNVTADIFFTSIPLAEDLLKDNLICTKGEASCVGAVVNAS